LRQRSKEESNLQRYGENGRERQQRQSGSALGEQRDHRSDPALIQPITSSEDRMPTITTKDGMQLSYNDWGKGQPVVFSQGWPLGADAFEDQMLYLAARGYRCRCTTLKDQVNKDVLGFIKG
jgi:hypothetical protein